MQTCATLGSTHYVDFDPKNPEHIEAFRLLCLGEYQHGHGVKVRQHPTLRFYLEQPFEDVRSMMFHKVGKHFVEQVKK